MVVRLIAAMVALGVVVSVDGDQVICRVPKDTVIPDELAAGFRTHKAAIVAALSVAQVPETMVVIRSLPDVQRTEWESALAHDLAVFSALADGGTVGAQ